MDFTRYKGMISNSGGDEYGGIHGGQAGDQTGGEWNIRTWYSRPWTCVLRYPVQKARELIAELAIEAAENNLIGYDQWQRDTFWAQLVKVSYRPKSITTACEADCSAGVIAITKAAGALLGIPKLLNIPATYTGNMRTTFQAAGFEVLTDSKYLTSADYLLPGDILLNDAYHTATNLGIGSKVSYSQTSGTTAPSTGTTASSTGKKALNGIDIAGYQAGLNTESISADFVIIKATQGTGFINPHMETQISGAMRGGKIVGVYHYANGAGVNAEVNFFLQTIKNYIGRVFFCLDWETSETNAGRNSQFGNPAYAKAFMDEVKKRTGQNFFLYGSKDSCMNAMDWTAVQKAGYLCWGAQYPNYDPVIGYSANPWQSGRPWGAFGADVKIHQYTSNLRLPGWNAGLDGDICYMTAAELKAMYRSGSVPAEVVVAPATGETLDKASLLELVAGVMEGKYGDGDERKAALGTRYDDVQAMINHIFQATPEELAPEVITGKYGNAELRKRVLGIRYDGVQAAVNALLKVQKSVTDLAKEVLDGKWGNDPERTKKLRAAGYDSGAVQKEVNRLLGYAA